MSGHLHAPSDLPLGKELPVPTGQEAGWAPDRGAVAKRKILASPRTDIRITVVVIHFNDSATPTLLLLLLLSLLLLSALIFLLLLITFTVFSQNCIIIYWYCFSLLTLF
jgi:hypothetical protein